MRSGDSSVYGNSVLSIIICQGCFTRIIFSPHETFRWLAAGWLAGQPGGPDDQILNTTLGSHEELLFVQ